MNKYSEKIDAITKDENIMTKKKRDFTLNETSLSYFKNKRKFYSYFTGILSIRFW